MKMVTKWTQRSSGDHFDIRVCSDIFKMYESSEALTIFPMGIPEPVIDQIDLK